MTQKENKYLNSKETELAIFKLVPQPTSQKSPLPYLDTESFTGEFSQIFKSKVVPILLICILNISIKWKRTFPNSFYEASIMWMPKLEVSCFAEFSSILFYPVFAHHEFHVLHLWQENDVSGTVLISSHSIRWFMISMFLIVDYVNLNHLIEVVTVKLLHSQVTLPYRVINTCI